MTAPQIITQVHKVDRDAKMAVGAAMPQAAPVRVLQAKRVAGHDVRVLEADDPAALATWLAEHGYASGPALTAWLVKSPSDAVGSLGQVNVFTPARRTFHEIPFACLYRLSCSTYGRSANAQLPV